MSVFKLLLISVFLFNISYADRLEEIRKNDILRVGVYDNLRGFGFIKDGKIIGNDIDIARNLATKLDVSLKLIPLHGTQRIDSIEKNKVDLVIATFTINEERKQKVDFSIPYFRTATTFITSRDNRIKSLQDFINSDLTFGVVNNSHVTALMQQKYPSIKVKKYSEVHETFEAFLSGQVDGMIDARHFLIADLVQASVTEQVKYSVSRINLEDNYSSFAIAVPKGEDSLREIVNKYLLEMEETGEALAIYNKWFGYKSDNPIYRTFKIKATE